MTLIHFFFLYLQWTAFGSPPVYCKCTIDSASLFYISTPFVRVPPSVTALEVSIEYAIKSCSGVPSSVNCSETFDLYKLEQNKTLPDVNPELFTDKVKTIKAGPGELTDGSPGDDGKRSKDVIKVNVKSRGVYFAFFDRSVCQALFSFKVSYGV